MRQLLVELKSPVFGPSSLHFPRSPGLLEILTWHYTKKTALQGHLVTTQVWSMTSWSITWTPNISFRTDDQSPRFIILRFPNNTPHASTTSSRRIRSSDPVPNLG